MKRSVKKINPARVASFDQQFWPVLVAVTVLTGIGLGAILTILKGPWMWGSLLLLPMLAAGAIFLLFQLDDTRLRRSLQFAIITSLAAHLLVLVFASIVNIFGNPFQPKPKQIAQQPRVRTIEISDQRAAFVWEETNDRETPEPKVEQQRQQPTTQSRPQPVPVPETKPQIKPQLVRKETPSESVPRQNRELSRLRRQTTKLEPRSSQKMTGEKVKTDQPAKPKAPTKVEVAAKASSVQRTTPSQRQSQNQPKPPATAKAPNVEQKPELTRTASQPERSRPSRTELADLPQPSPSNARIQRTTPKLPKTMQPVPIREKIAAAKSKTNAVTQPSRLAKNVTRRKTQQDRVRPALENSQRSQLSPQPKIARATTRRKIDVIQPSISNETSQSKIPRRSTTEATIAASPTSIENPSRAPESKTFTRELQSKTLSVSRSSNGIVGVGRSQNLDRFVGGQPSPARRASDSARRSRTQSSNQDSQMLVSASRAQFRRSTGSAPTPTSAFKADTQSAAKVAGSSQPTERTVESSAASITSASTAHRDKASAERGSANVDMGAPRIVRDQQTERRSGGGQPDVAQMNPDRTRRSRDRSSLQPSLVAAAGVDVVAPKAQSSATASSDSAEVSIRDVAVARSGGNQRITQDRATSDVVGELLDQGQSSEIENVAVSRERSSREQSDPSWDEKVDEDEQKNQRGRLRTRIAQAPVTRSEIGFGVDSEKGMASTKPAETGESNTESLAARLTRKATSTLTGSGLGRTATDALLQAATSLPVFEGDSGNRPSRAPTRSNEVAEGSTERSRSRSGRTPGMTEPRLSAGSTAMNASTQPSQDGAENRYEIDSNSVEVGKSDLARMEDIQGADLDILAKEGPAGLGIRPDNFVGVMTRPAARDSEQIQPDLKNRYRKKIYGGMPAINPDAVIAADAFRSRSPSSLSRATEPSTEAAIHLGLEFLAKHQLPDGSWTLTKFDVDAPQHLNQLDSDTAATGLALLAFQGAGYNHREFKYARQIDHALQWLIENQSENGGLYVPSNKKSDGACRLYSHGIAALALTEAYGMTQDRRLQEPAQRAVNYIIETQDARKGGWRYFDKPGMKSSDTSVSGWMMMALQSGRLAGLDVDEKVFDGVDDWLKVAADPENPSIYRYNPYAVDSKGVSRIQGRRPSATMTAVGLLMRVYSGWDRDDPRLVAGVDYLLNQRLPSDATPLDRDTYYWYYATQVIRHVGGSAWERWNGRLRPLLIRSQLKTGDLAGSWHPYKPVPDRWGPFGGRLYVTAMNLLSLEVRHRMLPLYQMSEPTIEGVIEIVPKSPVEPTEEISIKTNAETSASANAVENRRESAARKSIEMAERTTKPKPSTRPNPTTSPSTNSDVETNRESSRRRRQSTRVPPKISSTPKVTPPNMAQRDPTQVADENETPQTKPALPAETTMTKPENVPEFGSISGTVTLDRRTLKNAKIEFVPIKDEQAIKFAVRTNRVGRYNLTSSKTAKRPGVKPGEYKVMITTFVESPNVDIIDLLEIVPRKYNADSKLKVTVKPGKNQFNFELTSD